MASSLQFVTTPTADTPGTSLYLFFDNKRYLIGNLAEGTQRAMNQTGTKLLKMTDVLITGRTEWSNLGGLIGMILTLADANASSEAAKKEEYEKKIAAGKQYFEKPEPSILNLYGAPNLNHMLGTCRRYVFRKGMPLRAFEFKGDTVKRDAEGNIEPTWSDECVSVWALPIKPTKAADSNGAEKQELKKEVFDQLNSKNQEYAAPAEGETVEDREIRYDRMRRSIVRHMFDSDWSFDALVEKHISEVELPATMFVRNSGTHKIQKYTGPMPGGETPLPDIKVMVRTPWPAALLEHLPPTEPASEALSYIFRPHPKRGKFDAKKAQSLNLGDKRNFSLLAKGESVVNKDGVTITPDMVLGPPRPNVGVAVIDLPSLEYVDALLRREEWTAESIKSSIMGFVWILGPGVAASPELRAFMRDFNKCEHIVSSVDHCTNKLAMTDAACSTLRLGQVDPDRYGMPHHDDKSVPQESFDRPSEPIESKLPESIIAAKVGMAFNIEPSFELTTTHAKTPVNLQDILDSTEPSVLDLAKLAHEEIEASRETLDSWKHKMPRPNTEIITLGTGSALPSKYRNVSATLVRVPGVGNYLLDCGENTLGQLRRVFDPTELANVLKNLRMIWISHLHADHHLGTTSLIKAWYSVVHNSIPTTSTPDLNPPADAPPECRLAVISHMGMASWLQEYASVEDYGYTRLLPLCISENIDTHSVPNRRSTLQLYTPPGSNQGGERQSIPMSAYNALLGLADIQAVFVPHCHGAMAVSLTFPQDDAAPHMEPFKVSYSGDCRPSGKFAGIGRGSSVLIHEATFDDELATDAVAKKHSTTSEALRVAEWMGARGVVLTHFSQRYQKIPVLRPAKDPDAAESEGVDNGRSSNSMDGVEVPAALMRALSQRTGRDPGELKVVETKSSEMKVAIAFDYMRVKAGDIAACEKFTPALNRLLAYSEVEGKLDEKSDEKPDGKLKGKEATKGGKKVGSPLGSPSKKSKRFN